MRGTASRTRAGHERGRGREAGQPTPTATRQAAARWLSQHLQAHCATLGAINLQLYFYSWAWVRARIRNISSIHQFAMLNRTYLAN